MQRSLGILIPVLLTAVLAFGSGCGEEAAPAGVPDVTTSTLTADSPVPADGATASVVTITVRDGYDDPVAGVAVTVASSRAGDTVVQPAGPTDADGVATAQVTSIEPGTAELSASFEDGRTIAQKATVEFEGCENTDSDPLNCGFCGNVCDAPEGATATCQGGQCGFECAAGFDDCDGEAANGCETALDSPEACGSCVNACPAGEHGVPTCVDPAAGTCGLECEVGWDDCDGALSNGCERNVSTANACGSCDNRCPEGANGTPLCVDVATGTCGFECDISWGDCDGEVSNGCELRLDSPAACGSCENPCAEGTHARAACAPASGTCSISCDSGWFDCDGDPANGCEAQYGSAEACGSCDVACTAGGNAMGVCLSPETGTCGVECAPGFDDCDGDMGNGCEVPIDTVDDCGACGNACPTGAANGQPVCDATSLTCDVECVSGYADCNFDPADGCEQDLSQGECCVGGFDVGTTSTCLTAGAGATTVVWAEITDGAGSPFTGGTVSVTSTGLGLTATAAEVGSTGHYWFELDAPTATGTFTVDLVASGGACGSAVNLGSLQIEVVDPVAYADGGTGGCAPMDGNLRVRVVDESGSPLSGAFVMIDHTASATAFASSYADLLAGSPAGANTATTGADGYAYFNDYGAALDGEHTITAGKDGYAYVTLSQFGVSDVVLPLRDIPTPSPDVTVSGSVTPSYAANNTRLQVALVTPVLDIDFLTDFRIENLFEDYRPVNTSGAVCGQTLQVSKNIEVPNQSVPFLCTIEANPPGWSLTPERGSDLDVVAVQASAAITDLQNASTPEDMVQYLRLDQIGLRNNVSTSSSQSGVQVTLDQDLTATLPFTVSNAPVGDLWVVAAGDLDGQYGNGRLVLEGLAVAGGASGTSGDLRTAPSAGAFNGKQDLVLAVSFTSNGGASTALDRTTTDRSTQRVLDRFFDAPSLSKSGRSFSWTGVSTSTQPGAVHLARSILRRVTPMGEYQSRAEPFWVVYSPGDSIGFELPDLPTWAPRASDDGYLPTSYPEYSSWQLGLMYLGLDPTMDLSAFELGSETATFTHLAGNTKRIY